MIVRTYARRSRGGLSDVAASSSHAPVDPSSSDSDPLFYHRHFSSQESYGLLSSQESSQGRPNSSSLHDDPYAFLDELRLASPPSPSPSPSPSSSQEDGGPHREGLHRTRRRRSGRKGAMEEEEERVGSTLMEAQECGEMMEHMDEVNFALDGLRPCQPVRVRRASLLSLLSVSAGAHQRRLLRAQGTMKKIIDAVLALNFDDSPSTIAFAALFYVLASDAQDDLLLESPACVQFLINLLNPPTSDEVRDKAPSVGSRLLLIRPPEIKNGISRRLDSGATSIISKVQEILLHCKEIKPPEYDEGIERPELTAKWIGLLTMEKACLSTVSLEDIYGPTKKVGGDFKETLRELGGLDAVINIAVTCYSNMEGILKRGISTTQELKDFLASENVVLFLKCLKIMENATFLSRDNQNHLLEMTMKLDRESSLSCVELIIHAINFFSGLLLHQGSSPNSHHVNFSHQSVHVTANLVPESQSKDGCKENHGRTSSSSSATCPGVPRSPSSRNIEALSKRRKLSQPIQEISMQVSESSSVSCSSEKRVDNTAPVPCKMADNGLLRGSSVNINESRGNSSKGSNKWISINAISSKLGNLGGPNGHFPNSNGSNMNLTCTEKSPTESKEFSTASPDGHFDPFAFDEDELGPSKWESLTMPRKANQARKSTVICQNMSTDKKLEDQALQCTAMDRAVSDGFNVKSVASCDESMGEKDDHPEEELHASPSMVGGDPSVLEDCLLSAVKVLINLTNDNLIGCQQIGSYGGLDTMASLIVNHFPAFDSTSCHLQDEVTSKRNSDMSHPMGKCLSDHELDFLVAILGLLVNLVENDSNNRSRLVCIRIPAAQIGRLESKDTPKDVVHLLCSIFLVNKGPEQVKENGEIALPCNDEAALLQGEREAEMMIIEAYAALLLAFLSTESKKTRESIADCLPSRNLRILVPVLERFVEFHLSLKMISPETHTAVSEVIESCRIP